MTKEYNKFGTRVTLLTFLFALTVGVLPITVSLSAEDMVNEQKASLKVGELLPGEKFAPYTLEDQFHKKVTLKPETRRVIMSANMDLSKEINSWLTGMGKGYLDSHKTEYVSDITAMPGIITWLFARPKMQKYPFTILLADDEEFSERYGLKEDSIAIFDLDNSQRITALHYVKSVGEIPPRPVVVGTNFRGELERLKETKE